jgi:flagellar FliL protein
MAKRIKDGNSPGRSKLRIVLLLSLLGLAGTAGGAYYYLNKAPTQTTAIVKVEDPIFIPLEPFTVNLQPGGRSRFLHVVVTLKMTDAKSQTQVAQYLPEVRSRVLSTLSNREAESLTTPEGKAGLSGDILTALSQPFAPNLPQQKIAGVMFTSFMLQ